MENKTLTNHGNGNDATRLLASVFLSELADLMEKHKATLIIERVWDGEYDSHAELDFMVNGIFIEGGFFNASPLKVIKSDDIRKRQIGIL
jgi:hypothetical protein